MGMRIGAVGRRLNCGFEVPKRVRKADRVAQQGIVACKDLALVRA